MEQKKWNCLLVDAGARYGLHPSWRDARDICEFHLFEPEPIEATRLKVRYERSENITVHALALADKSSARKLTLRKHLGLSNLDKYDLDPINGKSVFIDSEASIAVGTLNVDAVSIDEFFEKDRVDFLKSDTEGSDFEILKGAINKLNSSILGIRVNVDFQRTSKRGPVFSEIDIWLKKFGFELQNLEFDARVTKKQGMFPLTTMSGSLLSGDAIWTRSPGSVYQNSSNELNVIYALFLYLNSLEDIALDFLVKASQENNFDLNESVDKPFMNLLETKILTHLTSALSAGWWDSKKITDTYRNLFNKDFPTKEELYLRLYP